VIKNVNDYPHPALNKLDIYSLLLRNYDKVLYIDSDIIVEKNTPNFFDTHLDDSLYILNEKPLWTKYDTWRLDFINNAQKNITDYFNYIWKNNYYCNTGVILFNKNHLKFFESFNILLWKNHEVLRSCIEQTYFNYLFDSMDINISFLDLKWNHLIINNINWDSQYSYFKHYTNGIYDEINK
jgi:alpha-N-acetylglucosamine transferase